MFPKAILYEINKELDYFCSILKGGVNSDVSHYSLECAPCRVGQEFTEVWHGAGRVPDFEMAKEVTSLEEVPQKMRSE